MKNIIFGLSLAFIATGCHAKVSHTNQNNPGQPAQAPPHVSWNVNRQFDDQGNLVRYDSSYTMTYSSQGSGLKADSLFNAMFNQFRMPLQFQQSFDNDMQIGNFFSNNRLQPEEMLRKMEEDQNKMLMMMQGANANNTVRRKKSTDVPNDKNLKTFID